MPEILTPFLEFFKTIHKYYWYEITVIIIAFILDTSMLFYLTLKKINREHLIDKIIDKIKPRTIISCVLLSVVTSVIAIISIANKNIYDYKINHYPTLGPEILKSSDTIFYLNFVFKNESDLPTEINDVYFYITLDRESVLDSLISEKLQKFPINGKKTRINMDHFNLPLGQISGRPIALSLNYLKKNKNIEIITTCFSKNNFERYSLKTEIKWDTIGRNTTPISITREKIIDSTFDDIAAQNNITYEWKPESVGNLEFQNINVTTYIKYIPRVQEKENKERIEEKEVKERRKLSENTYQESNTTSSTSRRKLSEHNTDVIDSSIIKQRHKLSNSK
jgi:hypothetical protein